MARSQELEKTATEEARRARESELQAADSQRELARSRAQLADQGHLSAELAGAKARSVELERECESLRGQRAALQRDVHRQGLAFEREKAALLKEKAVLEGSLEAARSRIAELSRALAALERQREEEKVGLQWDEVRATQLGWWRSCCPLQCLAVK